MMLAQSRPSTRWVPTGRCGERTVDGVRILTRSISAGAIYMWFMVRRRYRRDREADRLIHRWRIASAAFDGRSSVLRIGSDRCIAAACSTVNMSWSAGRMTRVGATTFASSPSSMLGSVLIICQTLSTTTSQCSGPSGETAAYISRSIGGRMSGIFFELRHTTIASRGGRVSS